MRRVDYSKFNDQFEFFYCSLKMEESILLNICFSSFLLVWKSPFLLKSSLSSISLNLEESKSFYSQFSWVPFNLDESI